MTRIFILAAAALAACAPDPSQALGSAGGDSTASGPGTPGTPGAGTGTSGGAGSSAPGGATQPLPPGFDPTKTGVQRGFWPDGTPWIIVVDVPWFQ